MKKSILTFLAATLFGIVNQISAQLDAVGEALTQTPVPAFTSEQVTFAGEPRMAIALNIVARDSDFEKHWKGWVKKTLMTEGKKNQGFYSTPKFTRVSWSADTVRFHYQIDKDKDFTQLLILVENNNAFVSGAEQSSLVDAVKSDVLLEVNAFYVSYYDEYIKDLQKNYDNQVKDLEKLRKKGEKLSGEIKSHKSSLSKAEDGIRSTEKSISDNEGKAKSLKSEKEQMQKEFELIDRDVTSSGKKVREKQSEFDKYNLKGELDTKDALRVQKDLDKLKKEDAKLQARRTKQSEAIAKKEKEVLKTEDQSRKLADKMDDLKRSKDSHEKEVNHLEGELKDNQKAISDEEKEVERAKDLLGKMQAAKAGLNVR